MKQSSQALKVAAIQLNCTADVAGNLQNTITQIEWAAKSGAQVVCLQELFNSLYFCQSEDHQHFQLAEPIPGPTTDALCAVAKRLGIVLVAGLFERRAAGLYHNSAVVIDRDGSIAGMYRKMHIPDDPFFMEKFYFTPGDLGFKAIQTSLCKIGILICWDQWYPEAARLTALQGAEILVYPTAIGWLAEDKPVYGAAQRNAWQTMMRSHAIANGVFVVAPNRCGVESSIEFWGSSFICDPYGNFLATAGEQPEVITASCDLQLMDVARTHWPFLRDRRIDAYQNLTRRYIDEPSCS
ncbi:MAG: carbon-nitrogen hydrolase [Planctomycetota bacterium]|jgi:N-carbamoylputrescine amidase